jgi:hypothetical protein
VTSDLQNRKNGHKKIGRDQIHFNAKISMTFDKIIEYEYFGRESHDNVACPSFFREWPSFKKMLLNVTSGACHVVSLVLEY